MDNPPVPLSEPAIEQALKDARGDLFVASQFLPENDAE